MITVHKRSASFLPFTSKGTGSTWMNSSLVWMAYPRLSTFFEQVSFLRTVSQQGFEVDES